MLKNLNKIYLQGKIFLAHHVNGHPIIMLHAPFHNWAICRM